MTGLLERLLAELRGKRTLQQARLVLALYRKCVYEGLCIGDEQREACEDFFAVLRKRRENRRVSRHFAGIGLTGWGKVYRVERRSVYGAYIGSVDVRCSKSFCVDRYVIAPGGPGGHVTIEVLPIP